MELPKEIQEINKNLIRHFGDDLTGRPIWRVVWSEDQLEKRNVTHTPNGIELLFPEVIEVKKYGGWIKEKYVLERLVIVPEINQDELIEKISYEPIWVFQTSESKIIRPNFSACKFIVDTVYAAMGKKSLRKYVDEEAENPEEHRQMRIKKLEEELFGDESGLQGKTHLTKDAVIVPQSYEKE